LDIVLPESECAESEELDKYRWIVTELWSAFFEYVEALTFDYPDYYYPLQEDFDKLAEDLKILGCRYVDMYRAFQPTRKGLYMHYCTKHIPEQVVIVGTLGPFSGTSIEAGHKKVCLFLYFFISLFLYFFISLFLYLAEAPDDQEYKLPQIRWQVDQRRRASEGKVCLFLYFFICLFVYVFISLYVCLGCTKRPPRSSSGMSCAACIPCRGMLASAPKF
jgi:hypothetical protein